MKFGKTHSTLQQQFLSSDPALEAVRHFQWVDVIYQASSASNDLVKDLGDTKFWTECCGFNLIEYQLQFLRKKTMLHILKKFNTLWETRNWGSLKIKIQIQ